MAMTSEANSELSKTICDLRARLLDDLHEATESLYRLTMRTRDAGLDEAARTRRARLQTWVAEQIRAEKTVEGIATRTADDFRREAEKQAAYTLLNRLVLLRLMEAPGPSGTPLRRPAVVEGGWESPGYLNFREIAPALLRNDETEGYSFLLQLAFEDLANELPGLYGPAGVADLVPIPASTLRHVVDELDKPVLASCWTDDMTLGWVYQYWNDPARDLLDEKIEAGGRIERYEIASKTQIFTDHYMVDWLLQNSLGALWFAICKKHGWTPEVEADGTLARLEERRVAWRARRDSGEVSLTELMPLYTEAERHWAYYVPKPIPDALLAHSRDSLRDLKLLDPALGSGHFLVVALDLLVALYGEEARHRGEDEQPRWSQRAIVEHILAYNLYGIDLDPRAVQIAAATLWLKARQIAPDAEPEQLNLVASNLHLARLPDDDMALVQLRSEIERETGVPVKLTDTILHALRGADYLGSLLKVSSAVEKALQDYEFELIDMSSTQSALFEGSFLRTRLSMGRAEAQATLLRILESFLAKHTSGDDLGLRLRGEQLAAGVRFVRMVREGTYDVLVANPPYQGTSRMVDSSYIEEHYPLGKADLFAAFLLRGLELVRDGGISSMLTLRSWMFIQQYAGFREWLLTNHTLWALGDLSWGAFREMRDNPVAMSVFSKGRFDTYATSVVPTDPQERVRTQEELAKKEAGMRCHEGKREFDPSALKVVPEWPLVYWWDAAFLKRYADTPKLGDSYPARQGLITADDVRYLRLPFEVRRSKIGMTGAWAPYIPGAAGRAWIEPLTSLVRWSSAGLEIRNFERNGRLRSRPQGMQFYGQRGVAFATIGATFSARVHLYSSIFSATGASVFGGNLDALCALLNSRIARDIMSSLNPTIHFTQGDVDRVPIFSIDQSERVLSVIRDAFIIHESHRESSVEFVHPGPSPWRSTQQWAQQAVDRPGGAPLPSYVPTYDPERPSDHLSFAFGVALGRFGPNGEGILDPAEDELMYAVPDGIFFLDCTLDADDKRDSLGSPAAAPLQTAWTTYGPAIDTKRTSLREWLALDFFRDVHKGMYENRPVHWPLSSTNKTFVAWVSIHRMTEHTLRDLLADHLQPAMMRLEGLMKDLRSARESTDKKAAREAERLYERVVNARDELSDFIINVERCASKGAPPLDAKCPPREQDARYSPDLDDGVMINSAALWPLLEPQWRDPKKWWKELSTAEGRKDYDWSHLAMRYWPTRVDRKCQADPSLAVSHSCFWRYHPARAWSWELRLQEEIAPTFRIEEAPYRPGGRDLGDGGEKPHRVAWIRDHTREALATVGREAERRTGRGRRRWQVPTMTILEPGLWSALPREVWEMELRLSKLQGCEFLLLAPDEPEARAAFQEAHPEMVDARIDFIANLETPPGWFDAAGGDGEDDVEAGENEDVLDDADEEDAA